MPSIINTNIASLNAQLNLSKSQSTLQTSLQRLSSGLRINSAADDAAGMAISDRMTAQINGLDQAVRNANDAISLSQTAEGALNTVDDNLQRIRQLALQSANSTNSSSDRAALNAEAQSLITEIQRVSGTTQFNGINLLDGSFTNSQFQVGANANQTISVSTGNATTSALGSYGGASTKGVSSEALSSTNALSINGTTVGPSVATSAAGWTAGSAAAKAAAINAQSGVTGVSATASSTYAGSAPLVNSSLNNGDLTINGVVIGPIAASTSAATQGANAAAAINLQTNATGVTATADANTGKLTLTAADGRNITISSASTSTATKVLNATGLAADTGQAPTGTVATATFATGASSNTAGGTVLLNGVTFTFSSTGTGNAVVDATHVSIDVAKTATGTKIATALAAAITSAASNSLTQSALGQYTATSSGAVATVTDSKLGTATTTTGDSGLIQGSAAVTVATTSAGTDYANTTFSSAAPTFAESLNYGDLIINGVAIGAVTAGASIALQATAVKNAINAQTTATGVTATVDSSNKLVLSSSVAGTPIKVSAASGQAEKVLTATGLTADSGTAPTQATSMATFKTGAAGVISASSTMVLNGVTFTFSSTGTGNKVTSAAAVTVDIKSAATGTSVAADLASAITTAAGTTTGFNTAAKLGSYSASAGTKTDTVTVTDAKYGTAATTGDTQGLTSTLMWKSGGGVQSSNVAVTFKTTPGAISGKAAAVLNGVTFTFASGTVANIVTSATAVTVGVKGKSTGTQIATALARAITAAETATLTKSALGTYTAVAAANTKTVTITNTAALNQNAPTNYVGGSLGLTTGGAIGQSNGGDLTLNASSTFTVTGTGNGLADAGLTSYQVNQTTLASLSIDTISGANQAITTIDAALNQVNTLRANLGATQNRFTSTVSNLQTTALNISAARSQIQDTNYASETANLTRAQILQQAGTAMLAQANQLPNLVLSLLK